MNDVLYSITTEKKVMSLEQAKATVPKIQVLLNQKHCSFILNTGPSPNPTPMTPRRTVKMKQEPISPKTSAVAQIIYDSDQEMPIEADPGGG